MIVNISFQASPGKRDQLVETLTGMLADTRAFDGCNSITFVEATDSPGALTLIEDWDSAEQYDAYRNWRRDSGTSVLGSDLVDTASLVSTTHTILDS